MTSDNLWKVRPHQPIQELAENLWWVQGSLSNMPLKRCMVVVRLQSQQLVIHNAIALDEKSMSRLEAWGTPAFLIVPNGFHRLDAPAYKQRYPDLKVFCPKGARKRVEKLVPVDGTLEEFPRLDAVAFRHLDGVAKQEAAMLVRSDDGETVVLNDIVFNMPKPKDPLGFLITTIFGSAPGPRVSRLAKLALVKDKKALKQDLLELAETPRLQRVVVAHERVSTGEDAAAMLRRACDYL